MGALHLQGRGVAVGLGGGARWPRLRVREDAELRAPPRADRAAAAVGAPGGAAA